MTMSNKLYINSAGRKMLEYLTPDTIVLDLHFILTVDKQLTIGMPYMLLEGCHTKAVRLLDVKDADNIVYLKVEELNTHKQFTLSWNMEFTDGYWLWSLADFDTLVNIT